MNHHNWTDHTGIAWCSICGVCRRADGGNKPCPGKPPRITLRAEPLPPQPPRDLTRVAVRTCPISGLESHR